MFFVTETQQKKGWLGSRVHKKKKKKSHHHQTKSSPLINITANKLFANKKSDKLFFRSKTEQHVTPTSKVKTNRINLPWFLCGSSKNTPRINIDNKRQAELSESQAIKSQTTPIFEFIPRSDNHPPAEITPPEFIPQNEMQSTDYYISNLLPSAIELHNNGHIEQAADQYCQYLHYHRNDTDARVRYALCLLDLQQYDSCQQQLDLLIECNANNVNNSMLQFAYGLLHHQLDHFEQACHHYGAALMTGYPFKDRIYNNLASLFRQHEDYQNAEKYQLLAIQLDASNHVSFLNYAKILCDMQRYADATNAYQNAISLQPNIPDPHVEFALFLMDIKEDYLLAATQLNIAHKLAPHDAEINDLLMQATEYCANMESDDSANSDTIVTFSEEEKYDENEQRDDDGVLLEDLEQIQFDERRRSNAVSFRKQSLPMNLPKPATALSSLKTISETSNFAVRDQICGNLPPPHNPNNPHDPVRRNSLMNMNRVQLNNYLNSHKKADRKKDVDDDDAVSVVSILSD